MIKQPQKLHFYIESRFEKLSEIQRKLVAALPENFTTAEGVAIALKCGVAERTFKRFICNTQLFRREKQGQYTKNI